MKKTLNQIIETDCVVIGAGSAGCTAALELADLGYKVQLFTKGGSFEDSNSYLIAGGLAAVPIVRGNPLKGDSFESHIENTLKAGAGLNDVNIVKYCIEHFYPDVIEWLIEKGVEFDKSNSKFEYDLHKEGGHSTNRIFHNSDATGVAIMQILNELVEAHPNITLNKKHMAIDLITKNWMDEVIKDENTCLGCYVYDIENDYVKTVQAKGVFVATGGLGKVFLYTSNPDIATGDGFAICYRAGLPLANMEFIQFHPTVFYDPSVANQFGRRVLFTEALRGAGGFLKLSKDAKEDFVLKYDPKLGSNSSRDVVSRAEDIEMRKNGLEYIWLDCTKIGEGKLRKEFSTFYNFCIGKGIDPAKESIPVVYAVHYSNGGVLTGSHGETLYDDGSGLENCYVIGETAYTGLHGATRLASNSGPEAVLFGRLAAKHFNRNYNGAYEGIKVPLWNTDQATESRDRTLVNLYWEIIRKSMTQLCGISRHNSRLKGAKEMLGSLQEQVNQYYWNYFVDKDSLEVRNILDISNIIVDSTLLRQETRACHAREDFTELSDIYNGWTIVQKDREPYLLELKQRK